MFLNGLTQRHHKAHPVHHPGEGWSGPRSPNPKNHHHLKLTIYENSY